MKKTLLFLFIILLVLSIGTVNATNETDLSTLNVTNDVENDNIVLFNENNPKSMTDLQNTINNNDTIILNNNYHFLKEDKCYKWSGKYVLEDGIIIDKSITIDGQGHKIDANHKMRIFQVTNNANVVLKNINFLNGYVDAVQKEIGGAIWNKGAKDLTVINCTFIGNKANLGGALNNANIINCTFKNNKADYGGAIYSTINKIQITDSKFIDNIANDGGAISTPNNIKIKNCMFINNRAKEFLFLQCCGGAIRCGKNIQIDNCIFVNNSAEDYGGAIYADTITWINTPSYFIGNYVNDNQGGAIYTNKFKTDVSSAIFIGNEVKANDDGGAIYISDENHVTFSNCYFENNRCGDEGGAIYLDSRYSHLTLINNDFINNTASDEGQTVFNKGYYGKVSNNYWGNNIPSTNNDQLVEWKLWTKNIKHTDNNPLNSYLNQTITFNVNNISYDRTIDSNNGIARLNVRVPNQMSIDRIPERIFIIDPPTVTIPLPPSMVTPLENRTITHIYKNVSLNNIEWLLKPLKASNIPEYIPPTKPKEPLNITFPVDPITQMLNRANEVNKDGIKYIIGG